MKPSVGMNARSLLGRAVMYSAFGSAFRRISEAISGPFLTSASFQCRRPPPAPRDGATRLLPIVGVYERAPPDYLASDNVLYHSAVKLLMSPRSQIGHAA
jgi:hypothetical protein